MPRKLNPPLSKNTIPLKLDLLTEKELHEVAKRMGEPEAFIIRLCLRAGLKAIKEENYELLKLGKNPRRIIADLRDRADPPESGK